jgi:peptidoglycan/LPS O-acetylase OafA/YrhL
MSHDSKPMHANTGVPAAGKTQGLARILRNLMFAGLTLLVVLNLFITPHDHHFGQDKFPGYWALFGMLGAVILAKGAKGAAHTFLGKDEDFYENGSKDSRGQGVK